MSFAVWGDVMMDIEGMVTNIACLLRLIIATIHIGSYTARNIKKKQKTRLTISAF